MGDVDASDILIVAGAILIVIGVMALAGFWVAVALGGAFLLAAGILRAG